MVQARYWLMVFASFLLAGCGDSTIETIKNTVATQTQTVQNNDVDNTPSDTTNSDKSAEITNAVTLHNAYRAELYSGHSIVWSSVLAASAQAYVDELALTGEFEHDSGTGYGENLYTSSKNTDFSGAIRVWAEEKQYYDYDTNSCQLGQSCGHYTQIIWQDSTELGCGIATYQTGVYKGYTLIACRYNPPGNYVGEKPY